MGLIKQNYLFLKALGVLMGLGFIIYYTPTVVAYFAFLLLLIPIWKSKNDFFWFAIVFIIMQYPGGLFSGNEYGDSQRLPLYSLMKGVSLSFDEIYLLLMLVKSWTYRKYLINNFEYKNSFKLLGVILLLLIVISFMLGMTMATSAKLVKHLISLSVFFSALYIFRAELQVQKFFKLIFPFVFIALLFQVYGLINGQQILSLFKSGAVATEGILSGEFKRPVEMSTTLLLGLFGSFLFLNSRRNEFSRNYLLIINIVSMMAILMTATRSWIIGFIIMYLFYFFINAKNTKINIPNVIAIIFFLILINFLFPILQKQIQQAWSRVETVELLLKGDKTAGGTLSRLTDRAPRVMEGFYSSTIVFGAGFSKIYAESADGHIGFHNILLNAGILGFIAIIGFAIVLFLTPIQTTKSRWVNDNAKRKLKAIPIFIPTVLFINAGTQFWGLNIAETQRMMIIAFYIAISSLYIRMAKQSLGYQNEN